MAVTSENQSDLLYISDFVRANNESIMDIVLTNSKNKK